MKSATLNDLPELYYKSDNSKSSSPHRPLARRRLYPLSSAIFFFFFFCGSHQDRSRVAQLHYITMKFSLRCCEGSKLALFSFIIIANRFDTVSCGERLVKTDIFLSARCLISIILPKSHPIKAEILRCLNVIFLGVDLFVVPFQTSGGSLLPLA